MTGKGYYITTIGDWKRRAGSFANSHWILLDDLQRQGESARQPGVNDSGRILVLVEADEGAHATLEDDEAFEALPHPLSQKPMSDKAQAALASQGVGAGASTFEAAEIVAKVHPLLRHRVF